MTAFQPDRTWIRSHEGPPLSIAHRGASAYAFDNTLHAFQVASALGADMWEVDVRLTSDGVPVAFHDPDLKSVCGRDVGIADVTAAELSDLTAAAGRPAPALAEVAALAAKLGTGIYLDAKEADAASLAIAVLLENRIGRVIVGANTPDYCKMLRDGGSPYPVSILVRPGLDPFAIADRCGAEIVHPCWERASDRPDHLLDAAFFAAAKERGLPVVTWHEERLEVMEALVEMPILGICSDQPELVARYRRQPSGLPEIVCHRGANKIAPENTVSAAKAAWAAGFGFVEVDVHETMDGFYVVHHDATLDRTTSGVGPVAGRSLAELGALDAGASFSPFFKGEKLPDLEMILDEAIRWRGKLYVEIKTADAVPLVNAVFRKMPVEGVFFWSFNQKYMLDISKFVPEAQLMARAQDFDTLETCLESYRPAIVEFNPLNADRQAFDIVRRAGARVMVAYMGNDEVVLTRLLDLEPDLLNLDEPFLAHLLHAKENMPD